MSTLQDQIKQVIDTEPVTVFIKGTPEAPACGNSMRAMQALWQAGAPIVAVDVLPDPRIRQELTVAHRVADDPAGLREGRADRRRRHHRGAATPPASSRTKIDEALGEHTQFVRTVELALD